MILAETAIFFSMLAGGFVAALIATFFNELGGAGKVARCVFDFLAPLAVGGVFFLSLYLSAGGVLRLYEGVAFFLGGGVFRFIYRRVRPCLKRLIYRLAVPIKSLERRIEERLLPLREKRAKRKESSREKRAQKRRLKAERREKRRASKNSPIEQSH